MELVVESDEWTDSGYAVTGQAHDRRVEIALEQVGGQFTYMRVEVKRNFFRRDRATAEALVAETESTLAQVKLASQNGASRRSLPRVSMADILRPVALARPAWSPSSRSRSDTLRSGPPAPPPVLPVSSLVGDFQTQ
jgi:hypothetical protein